MKVEIKRVAKRDTYTIGHMYIDGKYVCDTIEDKDRGLTSSMSESEITSKKVYGKTAIPSGTYKIDMNTVSSKFGKKQFYAEVCKGKVPRLIGLKGFDGVLIHCGNTAEDSLGCILVGENKVTGKVINSQATFRKIYPMLAKATDGITLTIG